MQKISTRRPVWLDNDQGTLLMDVLKIAASDPRQAVLRGRLWDLIEYLEHQGADPEPWLTVDDEGRVFRLVGVPGTAAIVRECGPSAVFRIEPVDEPRED